MSEYNLTMNSPHLAGLTFKHIYNYTTILNKRETMIHSFSSYVWLGLYIGPICEDYISLLICLIDRLFAYLVICLDLHIWRHATA